MIKQWTLDLAAWAARLLPKPIIRWLYRVGPLSRIIRNGLNRAAPQGLTPVAVAAGELAGMRLWLDMQSEKDYWLGTYELDLQEAIANLVRPGMVVYDLGANVGYITLLLARKVGEHGKVYAFEALPANLERLRKNLDLNRLASVVEVVPDAVVERGRPVHFMVGPSDDMGKAEGSAGRGDIAYHQTIEVIGLSLDEFIFQAGHTPPAVVKMDIEGGEILALPGMRRLLADHRPILLVELHGQEAAQAAWQMLKTADYRVCRMSHGFPTVASIDELDWKAYLAAFPAGGLSG